MNDDVLDLHAPFTYELSYDPAGNGGNGSMSTIFNVTSGGVQQTFTPSIDFPPGVKDSFPDLNRYGLLTLWLPQKRQRNRILLGRNHLYRVSPGYRSYRL